jgi:hypothetical protein
MSLGINNNTNDVSELLWWWMSISPLSLAMRKQPVDTSYVGSRYSNYDMHIVGRRGQFSARGRAGSGRTWKCKRNGRDAGLGESMTISHFESCLSVVVRCKDKRRGQRPYQVLSSTISNGFVLGGSSPAAFTVARLVMLGWASRHPRYYEALKMVAGL